MLCHIPSRSAMVSCGVSGADGLARFDLMATDVSVSISRECAPRSPGPTKCSDVANPAPIEGGDGNGGCWECIEV